MRCDLNAVMLIARFYPVQGGAEIQCQRLSSELSKTNITVTILTQRLRGTSASATIGGISVRRIGLPVNGFFGSLSYVIHGFFWLLARRGNLHILHAHLASSPALLAGIVSRLTGIPAIVKIGGSRTTGDIALSRSSGIGRLKLAFLKKTAAAFVCPSSEIEAELAAEMVPGVMINRIPNGVDTDRFSAGTVEERAAARRSIGMPGNATLALFAGRLEPGKGLELLIEAWPEISEATANARPLLAVIGSGSLLQKVRTLAKNNETIRFFDWTPDLLPWLRSADVFLLTSSGEGLPNVLLEAMSAGCACAASRIGGVTDIIADHEQGLLFAPGNRAELVHAATELLNNPERRRLIGISARRFVSEHCSLSVVADRYRALYQSLVERRMRV